jgi:hypothetical protein
VQTTRYSGLVLTHRETEQEGGELYPRCHAINHNRYCTAAEIPTLSCRPRPSASPFSLPHYYLRHSFFLCHLLCRKEKMAIYRNKRGGRPSPYRQRFLFHGLRSAQLIASIVVSGIMAYFMYYLRTYPVAGDRITLKSIDADRDVR